MSWAHFQDCSKDFFIIIQMCAQDNSLHPLSDFKTTLMLSLRGSRKEKEKCSNFMQQEIHLSLQNALILFRWYQKYHDMLFLTGEKTWLKCDQNVNELGNFMKRLWLWLDSDWTHELTVFKKFIIERIYPSRMYRSDKLFLDVYFDGSNFLKREC